MIRTHNLPFWWRALYLYTTSRYSYKTTVCVCCIVCFFLLRNAKSLNVDSFENDVIFNEESYVGEKEGRPLGAKRGNSNDIFPSEGATDTLKELEEENVTEVKDSTDISPPGKPTDRLKEPEEENITEVTDLNEISLPGEEKSSTIKSDDVNENTGTDESIKFPGENDIFPNIAQQQSSSSTTHSPSQSITEESKDQQGDSDTTLDKKISTEEAAAEKRKCKPVENVVFVKTHKTGSSTILNILQRYSEKHNLSMVLPRLPVTNHMLGWPNRFRSTYVFEHEAGRKYNLFANHARFSKQQIQRVMKDPTHTKFVTILREPLHQLESSAVYFKYHRFFNLREENLIENFLKKTVQDRDGLRNLIRRSRFSVLNLVKNPNAFDLGYRTWVEDDVSVSEILGTVKRDMSLVMISDHMLESLVLLKDELCWDLEDVVYFTLNKRPKRFRQDIDDASATKRAMLRKWSKIDVALFDHFNKTLWEKVRDGGERFRNDVERLKQLNRDLEEKCIDRGVHYDKTQPWFPILGYKIREDTAGTEYHDLCHRMVRPEIVYNNHLRERQSRRGWVASAKKPKTHTLVTKEKAVPLNQVKLKAIS